MVAYSSTDLHSFNRHSELAPPTRPVRKFLFKNHLWLSATERRARELHIRTDQASNDCQRTGSTESSDALLELNLSDSIIDHNINNNHGAGNDKSDGAGGCTRKIDRKRKQLRVATWNVQSLGNKFSAVSEYIIDRGWDILALSESWHRDPNDVALLRSVPAGYRVIDVPRPGRDMSRPSSGGGVALYFRDHFQAKRINVPAGQKSFESVCVSISTSQGPVSVVVIYRPPGRPDAIFYEEFTSYLEVVATFNSQLVIAGDLNIHFERPADPATIRVNQLLASFSLVQHTDQPTHKYGGLLDVIITRSDCTITDITVDPPSLSDHGPASCTIPCACPASPIFTSRQVRGWKSLNKDRFHTDLLASPLCCEASCVDMSADQLFELYADTLRDILDRHAPLHVVKTRICITAPWFDSECRAIKRNVRRLERVYRRTKDPGDRSAWIASVREKHLDFKQREAQYWEKIVTSNSSNPKKLWHSVSTILGRPSTQHSSQPRFSADDYLKFMEERVSKVREATAGSPPPVFTSTESVFSSFGVCSQKELHDIITSSPSKTCDLDPIPTFLVKDHIDVLLPFLTKLCNATLSEGRMPQSQKTAIVTPRLKKSGLDPDDVKSYRPISNLSFMSKVIEKVVFRQLVIYLDSNNLIPKFQSGFRKFHSTESATLKVLSDIFSAIDSGQIALLALLDVSAAFDTVDHRILLDRLSKSYGIYGLAHDWLSSFITGRTHAVRVGLAMTPLAPLFFGIPQGSILGPLMYILYSADVALLVESLGFKVHLYADDTQLYDYCRSTDAAGLVARIHTVIDAINGWMSSNRLCLNLDKTQYLWFGTRQQLGRRDMAELRDISADVVSASASRNLGLLLDSELTMVDHITRLTQVCFFHLRRIRAIRWSLTQKALLTLVHAFVCSRLDFCNGAMYGVSSYLLDRLQAILNAAARLILRMPKFSHISSVIREELHWLPIRSRIIFKQCLLVRNCLAGSAPPYLAELCVPVSSIAGRPNLRSASQGTLMVPRYRTERYGRRGFSVSGPTLWNSIPLDIRSLLNSPENFKRALKHYLMQQQ